MGEKGVDRAPELFVGQIVAKVDLPGERAYRSAGFVDRIALCRASEAFDQPACSAAAMLQRRRHPQKFVIAFDNRARCNGTAGDQGQRIGHGKAAWQVKLAVAQAASSSNGTEQTKVIRSPVMDGPSFATMAASTARSHITMATELPSSPNYGRVFQKPDTGRGTFSLQFETSLSNRYLYRFNGLGFVH